MNLHRPRVRVRLPRIRTGLLIPALVAVLVVAGMALGHGITSHAVKSGYDLAWLPDSTSGQAVQVDPISGTANLRMQVAAAGHPLQIEQGDGNLVVVDKRTGKITTIDLSTLLVGGSRAGEPGSGVQVLLAGKRMYIANLGSGSVQAVDPATEADIGTPWSAGHALIDVGLDGAHNVWALDAASRLVKLGWSAAHKTLLPQSTSAISGGGKGSVVVGHDKGVTVIGGKGGVARVGTGHDTRLSAPGVSGPLAAPQTSPTGLVPVASPQTSSVVIVGKRGVVVDNVAPLGCARPGVPAAFSGKVYVPCDGAHKVIVLGTDGKRAAPAIPTAHTGNAQLVLAAGRLLINVPGAGSVSVVDGSGARVNVPTGSRTSGVHNPTVPPPTPPAPPPVTTPAQVQQRQGNAGHSNAGHGNGGHHRGGVPVSHRGEHNHHTPRPGSGGVQGPGYGPQDTDAGVQPSGGPTQPTGPSSPSAPVTTPSVSAPATVPADQPTGAPSGSGAATAAAQPDGHVLVTWTEQTSTPATNYVVEMDGTDGSPVAQAPAGSSSATVTTLDPGTSARFVVHAFAGQHELWSATTGSVTTYARPGAVSGVQVSHSKVSGGTVTLSVSWQAAAAHGATVVYDVSTPGATSKTTTATNAKLSLACASGCSGTVTVSPANAAGDGTPGTHSFDVPDPTPTHPTEPPPPNEPPPPTVPEPPANGAMFVSVKNVVNGGIRPPTYGKASVTLELSAPSSWADWADKADATCELDDNGTTSQTVSCAASGATITLDYTAGGTHEYRVVANGSNGSVASKTVSAEVTVYHGVPCPPAANGIADFGVHSMPCCDCNVPCPPDRRSCPVPRSAGEAALPAVRPAQLVWILIITARSWIP